jgi:hypothetical protein
VNDRRATVAHSISTFLAPDENDRNLGNRPALSPAASEKTPKLETLI